MFPALAPHLPGCDAMQLGVYKFYELVSSSLIASPPFREKASDRVRVFSHIHRQSIRELIFAPAALINWGYQAGQRYAFRGRAIIPDQRPRARFYDAGTPA